MLNIVILLVILLPKVNTRDHIYFEYQSDCPDHCVDKNEPCIIYQIDTSFEKECFVVKSCEDKARIDTVCLEFQNSPRGGSSFWSEYKKKYYPEIPEQKKKNPLLIPLVISGIMNAVPFVLLVVVWIRVKIRRSDYNRLPGGGLNSSSDEIYQSTVEPV